MKIVSRRQFWKISALLAADALVFGISDPQKVPSWMLAAGFLLLMVTLCQLLSVVLMAANWYGLPGRAHRKRQVRVLTGVIGGLIALQSIGELGQRDVLVLVPLAVIAYAYISYGKGQIAKSGARESAPASLAGTD